MTLPGTYFDELYAASDDPWSLGTRRYEERKRALTIAALLNEHYATVFEPGCSVGVLTAELAKRATHVLAMDISAEALRAAKETVPGNVDLIQGGLPQDWPDGHFDLVVLSEVAYYFDLGDCARVAARAMSCADEVIAVHWRHLVADYPLRGDEAQEVLRNAASHASFTSAVQHEEEDFLLNVWTRGNPSVARRTGVLPT